MRRPTLRECSSPVGKRKCSSSDIATEEVAGGGGGSGLLLLLLRVIVEKVGAYFLLLLLLATVAANDAAVHEVRNKMVFSFSRQRNELSTVNASLAARGEEGMISAFSRAAEGTESRSNMDCVVLASA